MFSELLNIVFQKVDILKVVFRDAVVFQKVDVLKGVFRDAEHCASESGRIERCFQRC